MSRTSCPLTATDGRSMGRRAATTAWRRARGTRGGRDEAPPAPLALSPAWSQGAAGPGHRTRSLFHLHPQVKAYYKCNQSKGCGARKEVCRNAQTREVLEIDYRGWSPFASGPAPLLVVVAGRLPPCVFLLLSRPRRRRIPRQRPGWLCSALIRDSCRALDAAAASTA